MGSLLRQISPLFCLLILVLFSFCGVRQHQLPVKENIITIEESAGTNIPFEVIDSPIFEFKNKKLNVAVNSKDLHMLQMLGINSKDSVQILYINPYNNLIYKKTLSSESKDIQVISKEYRSGESISIRFSGKLYFGNHYCLIKADLKGVIPYEVFEETNE